MVDWGDNRSCRGCPSALATFLGARRALANQRRDRGPAVELHCGMWLQSVVAVASPPSATT
eukprot:5952825-Alexandrium_andersonii.AAC.1